MSSLNDGTLLRHGGYSPVRAEFEVGGKETRGAVDAGTVYNLNS